jgi:hypothetical protein
VVDTYGTHEVKLPAGDLILLSLHQPAPRGARHPGRARGAFFWAQSMVRDDTRRAMLFEMDQTIQRLREKLGETDGKPSASRANITTCCACGPRPEGSDRLQGLCFSAQPIRWL